MSDTLQKSLLASVDWWRSLDAQARSEALGDDFPISFSYNSGKIENDEITLHDTEEVFSKGRVVGFTGNIRTIFEMANLKAAWDTMLQLAGDPSDLSVDGLLSLHRVLTSGAYDERRWAAGERPGTFKLGDYVVADGVGYPSEEVPSATAELIDELNAALGTGDHDAMRALTISCYAHAKLVEIHPFADGNGRLARAVQNICLMRLECPPFIVREEDRMAYYGALDEFHANGALDPFKAFSMVEIVKTWAKPAQLDTP